MSLDTLPESVVSPPEAGRLEIVQHLLTEALRTLQATNQTGAAPTAPVVKPKPKPLAVPSLKPSRPALGQVTPEVRARAEELRRKAMLEPCGPIPPLTPEELAVPVAHYSFDPAIADPNDPLPLPVRIAFEQLLFELRTLGAAERAAALAYITVELPKRTAG